MSRIVVLSGSPRENGNTDRLVDAFVKGAGDRNTVEVISVHDSKVAPCKGCNACYFSDGNVCVQKDDMQIITQYRLVLDFFHLDEAGMVLACGAREKGEVREEDLEKAARLGQSII